MENSDKFPGLSQTEALRRLKSFGTNEIPEKRISFWKKFLDLLKSPVSLMLLVGIFLSLLVGKFSNAFFITVLIFYNFAVIFWQENKADRAIEKIRHRLNISAKVMRDGEWQWTEAKFIVPGDVIELIIGDIIPADIKLLQGKNVNVDESILTGESLSRPKEAGDYAYSGSSVTTGWMLAEVQSTGKDTYFGKTVNLASEAPRQSLLELDILNISLFLSVISLAAVVILTVFLLLQGTSFVDIVAFDMGLLIAGIPISLAATMSLIISKGIIELAKKSVIVRRLSSLEELANINLFLIDKTGTLTKNKISVEKIISYGGYGEKEIIAFAASAEIEENRSPIDYAITQKAREMNLKLAKTLDFIPADSERKRSSAVLETDKGKIMVSVGAPQVIEKLCDLSPEASRQYENDVRNFSENGYRVLGVGVNRNNLSEKNMDLIGILLLSDTLNEDAKETIDFMEENGIEVKIVTGDNEIASNRIARALGFKGEMITRNDLEKRNWNFSASEFKSIAAFSEILPADKYRLAEFAHRNKYHVAVTGDGINDLPALKTANVGIAVKNAADALKSSADIVLTDEGVSPIMNSVIEAKKILARIYFYSVYRISESLRIVIAVTVLGLFYDTYPLTPIQLLLLATLNSISIVSMAFNRVKIYPRPERINFRKCFVISSVFGLVGVINSLVLFFIVQKWGNLGWSAIQTVFFLNLIISGYMMIYVLHTEKNWFTFLPSKEVIFATAVAGSLATIFAVRGIFIEPISLKLAAMIWAWSFLWMQAADISKLAQKLIMEKYDYFFEST